MDSGVEIRERLRAQAQRMEVDCLYSAKGHFKAADAWAKAHWWLGIPAAIGAAAAAASVIQDQATLAGILSVVVVVLTAAATFLNPSERAKQHRNAGTLYNAHRRAVRMFWEVELRLARSIDDMVTQMKELEQWQSEVEKTSPQIPQWAYSWAKKGIEEAGEADYED